MAQGLLALAACEVFAGAAVRLRGRGRTTASARGTDEESTDSPFAAAATGGGSADAQAAEQVAIQAKYAGYIDRQQDEIDRLRRHENTALPADLDYAQVDGLSNEVQQKLSEARPETLARAGRIPGVTPAAVSLLLVYLKKHGRSTDRADARQFA